MKLSRRLYLIPLGVTAACALIVAALWLPPVQRWLALRALAGRPGVQVGMEWLAVTPESIAVRDLRCAWPGGRLALATGAIKVSLWQLIVHRRLIIGDATLNGLTLDWSRPGPVGKGKAGDPPRADPAPAETSGVSSSPEWLHRLAMLVRSAGAAGHLELPDGLVLRRCYVDGVVLGPGRRAPLRVRVRLRGGNLAPGAMAVFDFDASGSAADAGASVDTVEAKGALTVTVDAGSAVTRLGLQADTEARGPALKNPARVEVKADLARMPAGQSYRLSLTPAGGAGAGPLLALNAERSADGTRLGGTWRVKMNDRQIAPFALGWTPPEFSAAGEGVFRYRPGRGAAHVEGRLSGELSRCGIIDPRLAVVGRLSVGADFNLDFGATALRVTALTTRIQGKKPQVVVQALQPFTLNLRTFELKAADESKGLVQIRLTGVPAAWLRPWLVPRLPVAGGELTGTLESDLRGDRVFLRTRTPLEASGLSLSRAGHIWLPICNVRLEAEVERSPEETQVRLTGLTLRTTGGDRLEARGELSEGRASPQKLSLQVDGSGSLPTLFAGRVQGPVGMNAAVELERSGGVLRFDRLAATVKSVSGQTLASVSCRQPFVLDTVHGRISTVSGRTGVILEGRLEHVPFDLSGRRGDESNVAGELTAGAFSVRADSSGAHLSLPAPWRISALSAIVDGRPWLKDLEVRLDGTADYAEGKLHAGITTCNVGTASGILLMTAGASGSLQIVPGTPNAEAKVSFELEVPALASQPLAAGLTPPNAGRLSGEASFSYEHNLLAQGRLTLNGLVSPSTGIPLPVANLSFRAGLAENGDIAVRLPLLVDRAGERSDLTLEGTLKPGPGGRTVDARITSEHLIVDDMLALLRPFVRAQPGASGTVAAAADRPAWQGLTGKVALNAKSIYWDGDTAVAALTGRVTIDPTQVKVDELGGTIGADGRLQGHGEVRFAAGRTQPYASNLDFELKNLEVAPFFKAAVPGRPPTVEGRFDIHARAHGTGATLAALAASTEGDLALQCNQGIFRGLKRLPSPPRSGIVGSAGRLLGNIGEKVENLATGPDVTDQLAGLLAQIHFDQLTVRVARDPAGNILLNGFSLVSPNVRLQGAGRITYKAGKSFFAEPLQLRLSMAVTGTVENAITRAKLPVLSAERDDLGYRKLREPVVIDGTLGKPDPSQLYSMLGRSLLDIFR